MFGRTSPATLHGVVVQILHLLPHHRIVEDGLRMRAFLPDLILVGLVRGPVVAELIQQPLAPLRLDLPDKLLGGEALEIAQDRRQVGRSENGVEVVVHHHQA